MGQVVYQPSKAAGPPGPLPCPAARLPSSSELQALSERLNAAELPPEHRSLGQLTRICAPFHPWRRGC